MTLEAMKEQFAAIKSVSFSELTGGFPLITVQNQYAEATISLYGGQLLSFVPVGHSDLLFVSEKAYYTEGKAIKGGVPVCWPWFGADPEGQGRPAHGFVRNRLWNLVTVDESPNGETTVVLGLSDTDETREVWEHAFELRLNITIGKSVVLSMNTSNLGSEPFTITQALHTYFAVGDISSAEVKGLESRQYIDKSAAGNDELTLQQGAIRIESEVDRIYLDTPLSMSIVDNDQSRIIEIANTGSASCVVWNPWVEIAAAMADLTDDAYQRFVCVETTNAASDQVVVAPGGSATISATYAVTAL